MTEIKNLDRLHKKLDALAKLDIQQDVEEAAWVVNNEAKRIVPVDTGRLRASISVEDSETATGWEASVGTNVEYAAKVEFGIGQREQPYLTPALLDNKPEIIDIIIDGLIREIKNLW